MPGSIPWEAILGVDLVSLVGFTEDDTWQLRELKESVTGDQNAIMDDFYRRILAFPFFEEMIGRSCAENNIDTAQLVAHISSVEFRHWQRFFDGTPDAEFRELSRKIGLAHEKCLLTNDLYVASSAILLENFLSRVVTHHLGEGDSANRLGASLTSVVRMFFLDLCYAISAYDTAASRTQVRQISEPLLNTFEDDVLKAMGSAAEELNDAIRTVATLNDDNLQRCRDTVSSIDALTRKLAELGEITKEIESFVGVITEVSRKTKLLALNAAIEAARSGEYGRGFSVVANEVKALAAEAEHATHEVKSQSRDIQEAILGVIQQMDGSQKLVQAIDQGIASESQAIHLQNSAANHISTNLAAVSASARSLRERLNALDAA